MQYRKLGNTNLAPSVLGFGCSMIASMATRYPRAEVESTLCEAREAGVTFFDTADVYGQGDSERLLGKLFSRRHEDVIFCTKAGLTVGPAEGLIRLAKPIVNPIIRRSRIGGTVTTQVRHHQERQCFDPGYLSRRIEGSLRRLNVDRIDIFLLHNPPVDVPQRDAVFDLLADLKKQGKLQQYGVSCRSLDDARIWLGYPDIACLQIPMDRSCVEAAGPVLEQAHARGVGIIAREVFLHGVLATGSVSEALRPILKQPEVTTVLAGMTCRRHLHENLRAVDVATRSAHVA